jgi:hypothetical protein
MKQQEKISKTFKQIFNIPPMALHSETLEAHFESIRPLPPHQVMREQALKQAAQYGIPYEIAVAAIDAKL